MAADEMLRTYAFDLDTTETCDLAVDTNRQLQLDVRPPMRCSRPVDRVRLRALGFRDKELPPGYNGRCCSCRRRPNSRRNTTSRAVRNPGESRQANCNESKTRRCQSSRSTPMQVKPDRRMQCLHSAHRSTYTHDWHAGNDVRVAHARMNSVYVEHLQTLAEVDQSGHSLIHFSSGPSGKSQIDLLFFRTVHQKSI